MELELQIIATGMHLSPEFGLTYKEIEKDFRIDKKDRDSSFICPINLTENFFKEIQPYYIQGYKKWA